MLLLFYGGGSRALELHSPADVLRYLLIDLELGSLPPSLDWPVFCSSEPTSPDNCITCTDTAGLDLHRTFVNGERVVRFGVQVRVRGTTHNVAFRKARDIAASLDLDVYNTTVSVEGTSYLVTSVKRTSNILPIGYDTPIAKRKVCTINTLVCLERM